MGDQTSNGSESGTSFRQALFFKDACGLNLHDTMIYQKSGITFPDTNRYFQNFEYMFVLSKGKPKTANLLRDRVNKYPGRITTATQREADGTTRRVSRYGKPNPTHGVRFNVWKMDSGYNKSTRYKPAYEHPAIFPEVLAADYIRTWTRRGETVLDPFLGSGTTAVMAKQLGRDFIGIERDPVYLKIARLRISSACSGGK